MRRVPSGSEGVASIQSITRIPGRPGAPLPRGGQVCNPKPMNGGGKQTTYQESDQLVVAMKSMKVDGAKGLAVNRSPSGSISHTRGGYLWNMKQRE